MISAVAELFRVPRPHWKFKNANHRDHEPNGSSTLPLCPISRPKGKVDVERCASLRDDPRSQGGQVQHSDAMDGDRSPAGSIKERLIKPPPASTPPAVQTRAAGLMCLAMLSRVRRSQWPDGSSRQDRLSSLSTQQTLWPLRR